MVTGPTGATTLSSLTIGDNVGANTAELDLLATGSMNVTGSATVRTGGLFNINGTFTTPALNVSGGTANINNTAGAITALNVTGGAANILSTATGAITAVNASGGSTTIANTGIPTVNVSAAGQVTLASTGSITTLNQTGGTVLSQAGASLTTATVSAGVMNTQGNNLAVRNQLNLGGLTFTYAAGGGGGTSFGVSGADVLNNSVARTVTLSGGTVTMSAPAGAILTGADIGGPGIAGSKSFNAATGVLSVTGGGADIWGLADQGYFAYAPITGNFDVSTRAVLPFGSNAGDGGWTKGGIMARNSLVSSAAADFIDVTTSNGVQDEARYTDGSNMAYSLTTGNYVLPTFLRMVRNGNTFSVYRSQDANNDGIPDGWLLVDTQTLTMNNTIYVGLAVAAHNNAATSTVNFDNLSFNNNLPSASIAYPNTNLAATASSTFAVNTIGATMLGNAAISPGATLTMANSTNITFNNIQLGVGSALTGPTGGVFAATGTVNGTGTVLNPLTLRAGSAIKPGGLTAGQVGTLTLSGLTVGATGDVGANPQFRFEEDAPLVLPSLSTQTQVGDTLLTGNLTLNLDGDVALSGTLASGEYLLIDYAGTAFNPATRLHLLTTPPSGGTYTLSAGTGTEPNWDSTQVWLNVTAPAEVGWTGASTPDANWGTGGNWAGTAQSTGAGAIAYFRNLPANASLTTVSVDGAETVGTLHFQSKWPYTLNDGGGSITLNTVTGNAAINVLQDATTPSLTHTIAAPLNLAVSTDITVDKDMTLNLTGAVNLQGAGAQTLTVKPGTATGTNPGAVQVAGGLDGAQWAVNVQGTKLTAGHLRVDSLSIDNTGAVVITSNGTDAGVSKVNSLSGNGQLNLNDNNLVVQKTNPTDAQAALLDVISRIGASKIVSTAAPYVGLAAVRNDDGTGTQIRDTFGPFSMADGSLTTNSVMVKRTWNGDANVDGVVDAMDYFQIDMGYRYDNTNHTANPANPYYNGDFNGDGKVNADDYYMIDQAFMHQTGPLSVGSPLGAVAVPEPSTLGLLALGAIGLLARRRRRE